MRICVVVSLLGISVLGCGDDDGRPRATAHDAGPVVDAPDSRQDASTVDAASVDESSESSDMRALEEIITTLYAAYDRRSMLSCKCLAEMGAYKSTDECFKLLMSGPDWVSCSAKAVAQYNSPELLDKAKCVADQYNQRNDCLESTACGSQEQTDCDKIMLPCAGLDPMITLVISQQCPDTTILARLK
jgi:hypothetical protein